MSWLFEKKGLIVVTQNQASEDQLMELALGSGADDLSKAGDKFEILTAPHDFETVKKALDAAGVLYESASLQMIPKNLVPVSPSAARHVLALIEALEDHDDVQNVYANCDVPDEVMKEVA